LRFLAKFVLSQILLNIEIVNIKDVSHQLPNKRNMSYQAPAYGIEKMSAARNMEGDKKILFSVDRTPEKLGFEHLPSGRPVRAVQRFEELGRKIWLFSKRKLRDSSTISLSVLLSSRRKRLLGRPERSLKVS
jgi:hypothetical protein